MVLKIVQSVVTLGKVLFRSKYVNPLEALVSDVIILANGPSLASDISNNREIFERTPLAAVNGFCRSEYFFQLKPRQYFLLDPYFFHETNRIENVEKTIEILLHQIDWQLDLHIPYKHRNASFIRELRKKPNFRIHLINYVPAKGGFRFLNHWLYDLNLATPQCQNVVVFTTFVLVRRKATRIFLFGAENDWHAQVTVNKENWLELNDDHVYKTHTDKKAVVLKNEDGSRRTMTQLLESSVKVFKGYAEIERYSRKENVKVYNCSKNSFIDAFERLDDGEFKQMLIR